VATSSERISLSVPMLREQTSLGGAPGPAAAGATVCVGGPQSRKQPGGGEAGRRPAWRNGPEASGCHPFTVKLTSVSYQ